MLSRHLSVCLSVCKQDYSKTRAWICMKCCVSTDVGTWTNWLTFEPDPDYSPDAGTGLLSPLSYKHCYMESYIGKIRRICIGRKAWFYNGFIRWGSEPSKQLVGFNVPHHTLYVVSEMIFPANHMTSAKKVVYQPTNRLACTSKRN